MPLKLACFLINAIYRKTVMVSIPARGLLKTQTPYLHSLLPELLDVFGRSLVKAINGTYEAKRNSQQRDNVSSLCTPCSGYKLEQPAVRDKKHGPLSSLLLRE